MPPALGPEKWVVTSCHPSCSLNPRNLPPGYYDKVHVLYEAGFSKQRISQKSDEMGHHLSEGAIANHKRKHMTKEMAMTPIGELPLGQQKLSDLEILDRIIQAGGRALSSPAVRITPEMTMKAMELRLRVTQGSVFDDFMGAVAKAFGAPDEGPTGAPENIAAQLSGHEAEDKLDELE